MLNHAYQFSEHENGELALYDPFTAPWSALPERCIIMTHWPRVPELTELWRKHGFKVVTLCRHPLDVLISVLQYAPCGSSLRWLEGASGDERPIFGASPRSDSFLDYATGPRASALLSVSAEWWNHRGTHQVRYETLVQEPKRQLELIARAVGVPPLVSLDEAVEACTIERLRNPVTARHFWKGQPGLWRSLMTRETALRIASAHQSVFKTLDYTCNPDPALAQAQVESHWTSLNAA